MSSIEILTSFQTIYSINYGKTDVLKFRILTICDLEREERLIFSGHLD